MRKGFMQLLACYPEAYFGPCQTSTMEFLPNSEWLKVVNYIQQKTPLQMFDMLLNTSVNYVKAILKLIENPSKILEEFSKLACNFNSFVPNTPFLYPLKISEKLSFLMFSGDREMVYWEQMG